MKSLLIPVLLFSLAFFLISCEYESPPTQNPSALDNQILKKKPQPGGNPTSELISFDGDLAGSQVVEDCCPNAGPFPEYSMTLSGSLPDGTYDGNIFMNTFGRGKDKSYMVQFMWSENENYFIEIKGGVFNEDKKTKTLIATFKNAQCEIWINNHLSSTVLVNFVLTRAPAPQ